MTVEPEGHHAAPGGDARGARATVDHRDLSEMVARPQRPSFPPANGHVGAAEQDQVEVRGLESLCDDRRALSELDFPPGTQDLSKLALRKPLEEWDRAQQSNHVVCHHTSRCRISPNPTRSLPVSVWTISSPRSPIPRATPSTSRPPSVIARTRLPMVRHERR